VNSFNPSRWEAPTKEMREAWMPFGGGARSTSSLLTLGCIVLLTILSVCIGLHLAQMELRIATARFFRAYPNAQISTLDEFGDEDMEQVIYFLMFPKNKRCLIQAS
jgi:cytochrome P450